MPDREPHTQALGQVTIRPEANRWERIRIVAADNASFKHWSHDHVGRELDAEFDQRRRLYRIPLCFLHYGLTHGNCRCKGSAWIKPECVQVIGAAHRRAKRWVGTRQRAS